METYTKLRADNGQINNSNDNFKISVYTEIDVLGCIKVYKTCI